MKRHVDQWHRLGATDPYWAVLTDPAKRHGGWNPDEFFATGEREIAGVMERLANFQLQPKTGVALDFGCGVGRLSRALAKRFSKVIGVDISETMLQEARRANSDQSNIEFVHNSVANLRVFQDASFDFIYSNIVLQHVTRPLQEQFIAEFCRILRPGAVVVFQTPAKPNLAKWRGVVVWLLPQFLLNIARGLVDGRDGVMEMHWVPQSVVHDILARGAVKLTAEERYDSAGTSFISFRYYGKKSGASGA